MYRYIFYLSVIFVGSIFLSCKTKNIGKSEWINLIEKPSIDQWRAYNGKMMPPGWRYRQCFNIQYRANIRTRL